MKEFTEDQFNRWVDRLYNECVKVTGFTYEDVDYLYYTKIGCIRQKPDLLMTISSDSCNTRIDTARKGNYIVTVCGVCNLKIINLRNGKFGWSRQCYTEPCFDPKVALAVAFARYCKDEIPKVEKRNRIIDFEKVKFGTEIFYSGRNTWRTIKFIGFDPDDSAKTLIILKVTYRDGFIKLIHWWLEATQDGYFYTKE